MKKFLGIVGVLVLGMVLMTGMVEAADLYVPGSYTTIQAAMDAANHGDTIYVVRGSYKMNPSQFIQFTLYLTNGVEESGTGRI